jgi:ATP-binding cassette, subfamily F, member 3
MSSLEYFMTKLEVLHDIKVDEATAYSFLGTFGLHGRTAACPIGILSGGQKVLTELIPIVTKTNLIQLK